MPAQGMSALKDPRLCLERNFDARLIERRFFFGFRLTLSRLDENGPQQSFLAHLMDISFLKLQIEVRLPDQLTSPLYFEYHVHGQFVADSPKTALFMFGSPSSPWRRSAPHRSIP
jgi:hypothetical protein